MIELFGTGTPNVEKIFIALEELELPYIARPVDVFAGEQFEADFLKKNPNAKVPVIVDDDGFSGKPYTCFESGAILIYLAEKTGLLLPEDMPERYDALQWLMTQVSTVGPMFGQLVHFRRFGPAGSEYSKDRYLTQTWRAAKVIDQRLSDNPYLAGAEYSIADIATFPWLRHAPTWLGAEKAGLLENVDRWVGAIEARPAVKRAVAAYTEFRKLVTAPDQATPDGIDRLVARGKYAD